MKVCIDAGHYGKYNRSPVMPSYYESEMTWKLSQYLKQELNALGVETVMTRANQTVDRELVSRGYASKGCDLFISEHSNASTNSTAAYALCSYMRPNNAETYDEKSKEIAEKLAAVTGATMGVNSRTIYKEYIGDRDGNGKQDDEWYGVLQGAKLARTPGVIMENGFHTNLKDTEWLSNDANLRKLAKAQAKCIATWGKAEKKKDVTATEPAEKKTSKYNRSYVTTSTLNMRNGAGVSYSVIDTIPVNTKVMCYGYYSVSSDNAIWLYVQYTKDNVRYTGFVNKGWLK